MMKSRLAIWFDGVANRERKHPGEEVSGIRGAWAPGRRIDGAFLGRLDLGLSPLEALGLERLARGTGPWPMVPTMPPFFLSGRVIVPGWKKDELYRHFMGNGRQSMLFNVNFVTFLKWN